MKTRKFLFAITLLSTLVLWPTSALAEISREDQVKAAFIFNFAQFTEWPDNAFGSADSPFVVGVIGDDPFGPSLKSIIEGKTIAGRTVQVKLLISPEEAAHCQVLFVASCESGRLEEIFRNVAERPILTVGECDGFPWAGGTIRLFNENNKMRFEISPASVEKARLRLSSKLMKLAKIFQR